MLEVAWKTPNQKLGNKERVKRKSKFLGGALETWKSKKQKQKQTRGSYI